MEEMKQHGGKRKVDESPSPRAAKLKARESVTPSATPNRSIGFSPNNVQNLISLFRRHKDVLLSECKSVSMREERKKAWLDITATLNSKTGKDWTLDQIKSKWKTMLRKARADYYWTKEAARRQESGPDIAEYSESIWDLYGSKMDPSQAYRQTTEEDVNDQRQIDSGDSPGTSSRSSCKTAKKRSLALSIRDNSNVPELLPDVSDLLLTSKLQKHVMALMGHTDFSSKKNIASTKSKGSSKQPRNHLKSTLDMEDESSDVDESGEAFCASVVKYRRSGDVKKIATQSVATKKSEDTNDDDEGELRKRLLKAQIARIELENTKTESELEKLDLEKEKICLDKKRVELEMFLIRQKINNLCSVGN